MEKLLIIEDDNIIRANIAEILREEGYYVIEAENGEKGLELARKFLPDLIISDILMPEMDGFAVLDELQKDTATVSIPFIFLSAKATSSDIRLGMRKGADDYLSKPFKIKDLLDTVRARLSKSKHIDAKLEGLYDHISKFLPHELRTPLVAIMGFSEFIKDYSDTLETNEIVDMVGKINFAGNRLFKLIQKFLQYSEINATLANKEQLQAIMNSHTLSAQSSIGLISSKLADQFGRRQDLILRLAESDIGISEYYLQILLSEILENSTKFSKSGTPIEVISRVKNNFYEIEISDQGIGMSLSQIKDIGLLRQFNREIYNQSGIGIGLVLAKKIAEIHNGFFEIESVIDQYTKVTIMLPVYENSDKQYIKQTIEASYGMVQKFAN